MNTNMVFQVCTLVERLVVPLSLYGLIMKEQINNHAFLWRTVIVVLQGKA
jgi:hypothetical protein